jgi:hypothetical protein
MQTRHLVSQRAVRNVPQEVWLTNVVREKIHKHYHDNLVVIDIFRESRSDVITVLEMARHESKVRSEESRLTHGMAPLACRTA